MDDETEISRDRKRHETEAVRRRQTRQRKVADRGRYREGDERRQRQKET
jgi:hypothetical protein